VSGGNDRSTRPPPAPGSRAGKMTGTTPFSEKRLKSSSGNFRASAIYRPAEWLGRGSSNWTLPIMVPMHRRGLRRRLSIALIAAALGPVIAVSVVATVLIFSSVEQGIRFEAERGLQVARGLFLQQVQEVASGATALAADPDLLAARAAGRGESARRRLGELSLRMPNALFEITDGTGRIEARCARGSCDELAAAGRGSLEPAGRSPRPISRRAGGRRGRHARRRLGRDGGGA